jgi:plastocyanin
MFQFSGSKRSLLATALLLASSVALSACGDTPAATQPTQVTNTSGPRTVTVDMDQIKYIPQEITVEVGSTVNWVNKEAPKHTVTEDAEKFDSGTMNKDDTFSRTFDTPGTIGYFCKFHGTAGTGMFGKVIVVPASGAAPGATSEPTEEPTAEAAATPTERAVAAASPTAEPAAPTAAQPSGPVGTARFRDNLAPSDQVLISINTLPERSSGKATYAWLTGDAGPVNLGRVNPGTGGGLELKHDTPDSRNLLASYSRFLVTQEDLEVTPSAPSNDIVLSGELPPNALIHIRHLLVAFGDTPNNVGLEIGLLRQAEELRRHAEFMRDSQAADNWAGVKLHAEHVVNIIEGDKGPNFGDLDKDGKVTNPGDGYGLLQGGERLGYLQGSKDHAELAAVANDATDAIKLHAGHVAVTVDNVKGWVTTIRDKALEIQKSSGARDTEKLVQEILALSNQSLNGVDLKGDGQILPIVGSGGAITSYQHAQLMAEIQVVPGNNVSTQGGGEAQPTAESSPSAPTATVARSAPPPAQGGGETKIDIVGFKYGAAPATVKVGTKVTWTNLDTAPHTATADDNSFDSGNLQKGDAYSFTPQKAGTFDYYCALHGGPGKQGMSSTLVVEP